MRRGAPSRLPHQRASAGWRCPGLLCRPGPGASRPADHLSTTHPGRALARGAARPPLHRPRWPAHPAAHPCCGTQRGRHGDGQQAADHGRPASLAIQWRCFPSTACLGPPAGLGPPACTAGTACAAAGGERFRGWVRQCWCPSPFPAVTRSLSCPGARSLALRDTRPLYLVHQPGC